MKEHPVIWLQPWCDGCERHAHSIDNGRTWCQDEAYGPCDECGALPVKYVLAPEQPAVTSGMGTTERQ